MSEKESLIRARFAVSVLRAAKNTPCNEAITLLEGLAKDWHGIESDEAIANARAASVVRFTIQNSTFLGRLFRSRLSGG